MLDFFTFHRRLPELDGFTPASFSIDLSLDRLAVGVDNIRHDVRLSPAFCRLTAKLAAILIARETGVHVGSQKTQPALLGREQAQFRQLYVQVITDALHKAREANEVQIDVLAQIAVVHMVRETVRKQCDRLIGQCKAAIRQAGLPPQEDHATALTLKEKLVDFQQNRETVQRRVGLALCGHLQQVAQTDLRKMREVVFGRDTPPLAELLANPLIQMDDPFNDTFLIGTYDLCLGRRIDDPDRYEAILDILRRIYALLDRPEKGGDGWPPDRRRRQRPADPFMTDDAHAHPRQATIEGWLRCPQNIDRLLNPEAAQREARFRTRHTADGNRRDSRQRPGQQRRLRNWILREFTRSGLMNRVAATGEMRSLYHQYCPPLVPQQVLQYLIDPKIRRLVRARLKRCAVLYGKPFRLWALNRKVVQLSRMGKRQKTDHLHRYLRAFCRFHRDWYCCRRFRDAAERIHLVAGKKMIALSRANRRLYEFMLPHEQAVVERAIMNHTVIKADLRGSTEITQQMNVRHLNPASYFSLNFFDPIGELLSDYGAHKVFIEGDAVILAIFERTDTPDGWYSVARACGMAIEMLTVIRRINQKSRQAELPVLELGIGICHQPGAPTFLFDDDHRIMISPAINSADRLSGCHKSVRRILGTGRRPFNLFVYQNGKARDAGARSDDGLLRYNVNGIELSPASFHKLSQEIDLTSFYGHIPELGLQKVRLHTGQFPTKSKRYQRLVIREAGVPAVDPHNLDPLYVTQRRYYEVCTSPTLVDFARHLR